MHSTASEYLGTRGSVQARQEAEVWRSAWNEEWTSDGIAAQGGSRTR